MESNEMNDLIAKIKEFNEMGCFIHVANNLLKFAAICEKRGDISLFDQVSCCQEYNIYKEILVARKDGTCHWRGVPFLSLSTRDQCICTLDDCLSKQLTTNYLK